MLKYLFYIIFIVSVAMAALGIILSSRLKNRSKSDLFSSLLYFQVFIFTFGFYGIWGQVIIKTFLGSFIMPEQMSRFTDISILPGIPFLVFAWLMLIRFSVGLSGRKNSNWFIFLFLFINFTLLVVVGYFTTRGNMMNSALLIRQYYIIMNLVISFIAAYLIHLPLKGRAVIHDYDRNIIAASMFLIMIIQCLPLIFYTGQEWLAVIFIFTFFMGNVFLPVYLSYGTLILGLASDSGREISFGDFCRRFEVTPRERDIIQEICNGLSNKEISEKLFISLQTVKDHTHRIYIKTNVKSRVQLITLVKEEVKA
ncbi:MAG: LuxR C-terminal-related transcriptional regulator [Bacteroidales bacterium]